jgi:hypothetical protein
MTWPEIDLVVGKSLTDHDLRRVSDAAAIGAAVLAAVGTCEAEVEGFDALQRLHPTFQEKEHWCWAACVQAVLRHYGVDRTQLQIVRDVYGMDVDLPQLHAAQLFHVLNRETALPDGATCVVRGRCYPGTLLTAPVLYQELRSNNPVMVVHKTGHDTGHAVVIYGATFGPFGVTKVKYFDPTAGKGLGEIAGISLDKAIVRWFAIRGARS